MGYNNGLGQAEVAVAAGSEVAKLVGGLFGSGGVDPARKQIIDSYYNAAINGDTTGIANLQKWITTVPPHPAASVQYAQGKLNSLAATGKTVGGTGSAVAPLHLPTTGGFSMASMGGISMPVLIGGAILGYLLLERRR